MAALLVTLGIMAVMMTVAMPVWKQAAQREKEEELVFRGQQYVHAITLFSRKYANNFPPNTDVLVRERFLRKKFKDPITNDDFQPVPAGQQGATISGSGSAAPGQIVQRQTGPGGRDSSPSPTGGRESAPPPASGRGPGGGPTTGGRESGAPTGGRSTATPAVSPFTPSTPGGRGATPGGGGAGIIGVVSKSKDKSIRLYNGRSHYNEWAFVYTAQMQAPGAGGAPGAAVPGQRGRQGQGQTTPGQRGIGTSPFGSSPPGRGQPGGRNPFPGGTSPFQPPPTRGRSGR